MNRDAKLIFPAVAILAVLVGIAVYQVSLKEIPEIEMPEPEIIPVIEESIIEPEIPIIEPEIPIAEPEISIPSPVTEPEPINIITPKSTELTKINNNMELKTILENFSSSEFGAFAGDFSMMDIVADSDGMMRQDSFVGQGSMELSTMDAMSEKSVTHSSTNIQVESVDESDYVKTDGSYFYILRDTSLVIIDSWPPESAELVSKSILDVRTNSFDNMFLYNDAIIAFYTTYEEQIMIAEYDFVPSGIRTPVTHAIVIDIGDKQKPKIKHDYTIEGNLQTARMINNVAYFITSINPDYNNPRIPIVYDNNNIIESDSYWFNPNAGKFMIVTSVDTDGNIQSSSFLGSTPYGNTNYYVSENNFYLAFEDTDFFDSGLMQDRFETSILPQFGLSDQERIKIAMDDNWAAASDEIIRIYESLPEEQGIILFEKIENAVFEYDKSAYSVYTTIHRIALDDGNINHAATGKIPGILLNQFSMDENDGKLRAATTTEAYDRHGFTRANSVVVLNPGLEILGQLDNIAIDESIFSARFIDDRLYLVTFEQIDPFFVIDLSSDSPKILGELKLPGFSNYLHKIDENTILGVGRDTKLNEWGGVIQQGVKLAIFDVKDVNNPVLSDDVVIGSRNTDSDALYDHKAFYFDGVNLVMPISGDSNDINIDTDNQFWNGFLVWEIQDGKFGQKGSIYHKSDHYDNIPARTFYVGDALYTIGGTDYELRISDIDSLKEINSVMFSNTGVFLNQFE